MPVFLILLLAGAFGFLVSSNVQIPKQYSDGRSTVQGVSVIREGESSKSPTTENLKARFGTEKIKVGYELKDGQPMIKAETERGKISESRLRELELAFERSEVRVATADGQMAVIKGQAGALSRFPLTLDLATNSLVVTTPKGTKTVAVLPDAAIHNMLASKVMDDIKSASTSGYLASVNQMVELKEKNGVVGYEIEGERKHKLLGLLSLKSKVKAFVSAENGQVVETEQSIFGRILNRLAP